MPSARLPLTLLALTLASSVLAFALTARLGDEDEGGIRDEPETPTSIDARVRLPNERTLALVVGGGADPESSGVQLEQDVELALRALGPERAHLLFGAGEGPVSIRVEHPTREGTEPVRALLAELFDPRGRDARYRPTTLSPAGPATREHLDAALDTLTSLPGEALTLFVAAHGAHADDPSEAFVELWSGDVLSVGELAELYTRSARPIVTVLTSCYGGAFAEVALETRGEVVSCGLFATTSDRVASGCDTNPTRTAQEGFALHFFAALRGEDRSGARQPLERFDLDGDGRISYLEAHARARIASRGFDVPTTTSERWLLASTSELEAELDDEPPASDPIEDAVIAALGAELDARELPLVRAMSLRMSDELAAIEAESEALEAERDVAFRRLRIALLERWPTLDDPWHPEHAALIAREGPRIVAMLEAREELRTLREVSRALEDLAARYDAQLVEESRVLRLLRAMENVRMLSLLQRRGGEARARYEALRRCEAR